MVMERKVEKGLKIYYLLFLFASSMDCIGSFYIFCRGHTMYFTEFMSWGPLWDATELYLTYSKGFIGFVT